MGPRRPMLNALGIEFLLLYGMHMISSELEGFAEVVGASHDGIFTR